MAALPAALRVEGKGRAQEDPCLWKGAGPDQGLQGVCHSLSLVSGFPEASCWLPPCSSLQLEDLHPGWPRCLNEETIKNLDLNIKYSLAKNITFYLRGSSM